ncbi:hypothetical protein SDC9_107819 [bioreactor metagenome]|uniref:Uncharacterized protein n=1 Tax=bioreactor metagenome TaxID=1076179 RepID=A0A645B6A8_9ZZZZ
MDAQARVGGNDKGTNIERGGGRAGHPVGFHPYQSFDGLQRQILRQSRNTKARAGVVEASYIVHGAEKLYPAVRRAVGLHALENLLSIMEHHGGGIQDKGSVGYDPGVMPALAGMVVH